MLYRLLVLLHLLAAIVWLGGMFFAYFCLRPAAAAVLDPPQRLSVWSSVFARFLPLAAVAVLVILASGSMLLSRVGMSRAPLGWHIMLTLGVVMSGVFAYVYLVLYPRLRERCAVSAWPEAATALNSIRRLVALNLVLGICAVAAAMSAR
jgi:uncharacterized membrane protein